MMLDLETLLKMIRMRPLLEISRKLKMMASATLEMKSPRKLLTRMCLVNWKILSSLKLT